MKPTRWHQALALLVAVAPICSALDIPKYYNENNVLMLTKSSFAATVKDSELWFVEFLPRGALIANTTRQNGAKSIRL
jgi:hypothetical protein